ncbi:MAG: hypothetical protein ABI210_04030, partial [Abditibacteriaceae bacterium]
MNIKNRKTNKPFRFLAQALGTLVVAVLASCYLTPVCAADYGAKIVAPVREDTAQHSDMNLGPAVRDLQSSLQKMTGTEYSDVRGDDQYKGDGIFIVRT